jgi:pyruvate,water dikinase
VPVPDPLPRSARYATIAAKLPVAIARTPRRLARLREETDAWWRATCTSDATTLSIEASIALLDAARARLQTNMRAHILGSMLAQATYGRLTAVCAAAGLSGHENNLTTGYGGMEESKALADLWLVAQGQLQVEEFIDRHGYHGPAEGEISSIVWREDLRPVTSLIERFKTLDPTNAPDIRAKRQGREARAAEKCLLAELNAVQRPAVRALLRLTGRYMLLREVGKAAYLQAIDGARFATRAIGGRLEEAGAIDERDDVFHLTYDELRIWRDVDVRWLIPARKARWQAYHDLDVPENWVGQLHLDPAVRSPSSESDDEPPSIEGTGVSPGAVEGRAVVVLDPFVSGDVVEPGDIVVCPWTDPSWAPTMMVCSGLVIETGGPLSHGAIIARELGVPCVVAVAEATRRLRTGDTIRIDGASGTVEILHRDAAP